jgi:hypothetical protein
MTRRSRRHWRRHVSPLGRAAWRCAVLGSCLLIAAVTVAMLAPTDPTPNRRVQVCYVADSCTTSTDTLPRSLP